VNAFVASAAVAVAVSLSGADPRPAPDVDGFLEPQTVPVDFSEGRDQTIDVPDGSDTVILAAPADTSYTVRFNTGDNWEKWATVHATLEEGPDVPESEGAATEQRPVAIGPMRLPADTVQMQVVSIVGEPATLEAVFLSDQETGAPRVAGAQLRADGAGQPTIMPRSAWADEGWSYTTPGCQNGPRYTSSLRAMVVHHTVNDNNYQPEQVDDLLRAIYHAHVKINGWCDVGYNFLVDRFGTIWEGRSGGVDKPVVGGHAKGFNSNTVGVAMLGQHHPSAQPAATRPSAASEDAITALATWKFGLHGIDPDGTTWLKNQSTRGAQRLESGQWHLVPTVVGHRDVGATACPGDYGIAVARGVSGSIQHLDRLVPQASAWKPALSGPGFVTVDSRGGLRPAGTVGLPGIGQAGDARLLDTDDAPVAVSAVRTNGEFAGYALDAAGGLHPIGTAPSIESGAWRGKSVVDVAVAPGGDNEPAARGGWVIAADASVTAFGTVPNRGASASERQRLGGAVVAGALDEAGNGYLVSASGKLAAVGSAPTRNVSLPSGEQAIDVTLQGNDAASGGWVLGSEGSLIGFGGADNARITANASPGDRTFVAAVSSGAGVGGWVLTDDGLLWPFGGQAQVAEVYTDASTNDAVDVTGVSFSLPANFAQTDQGKYTAALLALFLGEDVDRSSDLYLRWGAQVYSGVSHETIAEALARSPQWAGVQIDRIYRDVLGRQPDASGRAYWLSQVERGLSMQSLGVYFYGSEEYFVRSGGAEGYTTRLYQTLLGRKPDQKGLNYWVGVLETGRANPDDVAAGFYASVESRRQRVGGLYRQVLGRSANASELDHWAQILLSKDDVEVAALLAASPEFYQKSLD